MAKLIFICCVMLSLVGAALSSWSSAPGSPNGQYHIQTDEGPERYFRYQTQSGQYRKEKRLQDGTVVGSYGWIDADGFLRLRDYIADDQGYRILKSKTVFVGQNRPIEEAIKSAKKVTPQAGILVGAHRPISAGYPARGTPAYPSRGVSAVAAPVTPAPTFASYLPPSITPQVLVSHNSIESSTQTPEYDFRPTVEPIAAVSFTERPPSYYATTPAPEEHSSSSYLPPKLPETYLPPLSTPSAYLPPVESSTYLPPVESSSYPPPAVSSTYLPPIHYYSSTPAPIVAITSNVLGDYRRKYHIDPVVQQQQAYEQQQQPSYGDRNLYSTKTLNVDPFSLQSTPIDRKDQYVYQRPQQSYSYNRHQSTNPAAYAGNQIGNGYDPQYPTYDGVSVTNNGFRYYLPKQYHEEENSGSDTRSGSFGYVDPFGIRRVIYYNTSPGSGFVHRKNNRYVGFDATPYDPRPV